MNRNRWRGTALFVAACALLATSIAAEGAFAEPPPAAGEASSLPTSADGLTEAEVADINRRMRSMGFDELAAKWLADRYAQKPIARYLIRLVEDRNLDIVLRVRAMQALAYAKDARGTALFRKLVDAPLKDRVTEEEWSLLHAALLSLGVGAADSTLDFLFEAATEDYWLKRNPAACREKETPEGFRRHMRLMALNGIAFSGSARAIDAFTKWEGVPEDLRSEREWLLRLATLRSQGLIRDPAAKDAAVQQ